MNANLNNNYFVYYFGFLGFYFSVRFFAYLKNMYKVQMRSNYKLYLQY